MRLRKVVVAFFLLPLPAAYAEIRLPHLLSDHAVLQRDRPVRIWGWAEPRERITVRFHGQTQSAIASSIGEWETSLLPEAAGGPYTLAVTGNVSAAAQAADILVGDVWLASGQSNMEFPLEGFSKQPLQDGDAEIAAATHPRIRLLLQKRGRDTVPQVDIAESWSLCTPDTARHFSAVAYFFGRELEEYEHVPIGLIDATWGGTPAHAWISPLAIAQANLNSVFLDYGVVVQQQARADQFTAFYKRQDDDARAAGRPVGEHPWPPGEHKDSYIPGGIFNHMIAPDTRFTLRGVIWYQGESDSDPQRNPYYARVFPTLITDWRQQWGQGDFPFLFVQLTSYHAAGGWPEVRDAQRRSLSLRNTAMAVTLDAGVPEAIHPPDKQTVGHRLALAARGMVYGEAVDYQSPEFIQATVEPGALRAWFAHAENLHANTSEPGGFEIAGEDRRFYPAHAAVQAIAGWSTVLLTAPEVSGPRFVRYDWNGEVHTFLYNRAGLPAGTFTSE